MFRVLKCSERAMARCSDGKNCARYGGNFVEGSRCHQFNQQVSKYPFANSDQIRAMSDEELASFLYGFVDLDSKIHYCKNKPECDELLDTEDGIPAEMCTGCLCEWLRQPAEEDFP